MGLTGGIGAGKSTVATTFIERGGYHVDADKIARLAHLVGATRPGYDLSHARRIVDESPFDFDVTYLEVPALAISSSYLRQRVGAGQSLRYLTPGTVVGYIHKHHLYSLQHGC